jgi:hypothetical protein
MLGFGSCRSKFRENMPLFVGLLVPCHREQGVLPILSIGGLQIAKLRDRIMGKDSATKNLNPFLVDPGRVSPCPGSGKEIGFSEGLLGHTGPPARPRVCATLEMEELVGLGWFGENLRIRAMADIVKRKVFNF